MRALLLGLPVLLLYSHGAFAIDDEPDVRFLDEEAARAAIVDESMEPYFSLLQPMEMQAKTGSALPGETLEAQRAACKQRYRAAVGEFTEDEQKAIRWYVGEYHAMLRKAYPLYAKTPWRFLKLKPSVEGGLPHTRGSCIVLPPNRVSMLAAARLQRRDIALQGAGRVLLHEQLHVVQRANRERMERFYTEIWKFLRPEVIDRGPWLERHQVVNPDGVDTRWVYEISVEGEKRWIQPDLILTKGEGPKRMPHDLRMVAVMLDKTERGFAARTRADGTPVYEPLFACRPYVEDFPGTSTSYHPNETMADLFVKLVVHDHVLERGPEAEPVLDRYRREFRALLGN